MRWGPCALSVLVLCVAFVASAQANNCGRHGFGKLLRTRFSDNELVSALVVLKTTGKPQLLGPEIRAQLRGLARVKTDEELRKADTVSAVLKELRESMGVEEFETALGTQAGEIKSALNEVPAYSTTRLVPDPADMNRGWGWRLLPEDDKAFKDPKYLANYLRQNGATGDVMSLQSADKSPRTLFEEAWHKIAPQNTMIERFTLTGTDANNLLYDIAELAVEKKTARYRHKQLKASLDRNEPYLKYLIQKRSELRARMVTIKPEYRGSLETSLRLVEELISELRISIPRETREVKRLEKVLASAKGAASASRPAEILAFNGVYAGGGGRVHKLAFNYEGTRDPKLLITSPHTTVWSPTDPKEIARLARLEQKALREVKKRVQSQDPPIGGILIEPILGAYGVYFYRPEFLRNLRRLCDELKIPIFADEVLTGGGRTGKFFAYQHYEGFEPDFVTFGKGLQISGLARVTREGGAIPAGAIDSAGTRGFVEAAGFEYPQPMLTLRSYNEALLKSAQVMNRIREDGLMENAVESGEYLLKRLRAASGIPQLDELSAAAIARGKGALIHFDKEKNGDKVLRSDVTDAMGRLMPPLTITPEQIDTLVIAPAGAAGTKPK